MNFDEVIDRRNTHSVKWDMMEPLFGVPADDGIAMWVADMDFRPPDAARKAIERMLEIGIFGYYGDDRAYRDAIRWWMRSRHGWEVEPDWIFTAHGLVNGTAMCIDAFSEPGDDIVLFTPVYHAFARVIRASGRGIVECRLALNGNRYGFDFDSYAGQMTGRERIAILCSPHNPGGTVWSRDELRQLAAFCTRHDLTLVSDEIHHDLLMPGSPPHTVMHLAEPEIEDRLVVMTATTKTFNLAGAHSGNVIIPDDRLRKVFARRMDALGMSPNSFGLFLAEAVYSPEGAAWVDEVMAYINENRWLFDSCMDAIGAASMPLDATYLAWVDFSPTGLTEPEVSERIEGRARIAVNRGPTFGGGGENFHRFNLATPRPVLERAIERMHDAFSG